MTVELTDIHAELLDVDATSRAAWAGIRSALRLAVGESTFDIWLDPLDLAAISPAGELLLLSPPATRSWVCERFGRVLARISAEVGRPARLVSDRERQLLAALTALRVSPPVVPNQTDDQQEAV